MSEMPATNKPGNEVKQPKIIVIFPAKNEAATIQDCIDTVKQSKFKPDIIVADGYSTDKTREIAIQSGAEVVMSPKRIHPGKGAAMKIGLEKALEKKPEIIVFLDADIKNLSPQWLDILVLPIIDGHYDMVRGMYLRAPRDAGVTKLVAKPLLRVFFPEIAHFDQPLSGEIAAKADVWKAMLEQDSSPDGWGIDVWFLIETAMLGFNVTEVFLGTKIHSSFTRYAEDLAKLSKMGEQVALAIINEAIKHNRIDNVKATAA